MSFLAPWLLLLGGAAIVPLLIHLLRRRIGLKVDFPAARYLARAEREHSRTLRLRNLLLMLLRVAAVLLLATAAARPVARMTGLSGGGHAPTALAIVIDNSLSTGVVEGGSPLIDSFKRTARMVLSSASPDDRLWIITADATLRGGSAAVLSEQVERVRPIAGAGNLREALGRAATAVQGSGLEARSIVVLTDGQRTTWAEPPQIGADLPVLVLAPANAAPVNRAVVAAEARPVRWTPRGTVAARVLGPSADSTTYRIALGQRTVARGTVLPGEEALLRAAPAERGWVAGTVEIEPDELPADNVRHFALWIGPPPSVRVAPGAGPFVQNAVDVLRASERVAQGSAITVGAADEISATPALVLPPTDPVRLGAANRSLERLGIPWRFGAPHREVTIARSTAAEAGAGAGALGGGRLTGVSVRTRYRLVPRGVPDAETLAVVGREPWIVSGERYVLVGSPLNPDATSFPVSAGFLPWVGDILAARLHADPGEVQFVSPGQTLPRPAGADALESEQGARTQLAGTFQTPSVAGTYFLIRGNRRVGAVVVNAEVNESRLDRWDTGALADHVARDADVARTNGELVNRAFSGAARQSLIVPMLIASLLLLFGEMFAASGGRNPG